MAGRDKADSKNEAGQEKLDDGQDTLASDKKFDPRISAALIGAVAAIIAAFVPQWSWESARRMTDEPSSEPLLQESRSSSPHIAAPRIEVTADDEADKSNFDSAGLVVGQAPPRPRRSDLSLEKDSGLIPSAPLASLSNLALANSGANAETNVVGAASASIIPGAAIDGLDHTSWTLRPSQLGSATMTISFGASGRYAIERIEIARATQANPNDLVSSGRVSWRDGTGFWSAPVDFEMPCGARDTALPIPRGIEASAIRLTPTKNCGGYRVEIGDVKVWGRPIR